MTAVGIVGEVGTVTGCTAGASRNVIGCVVFFTRLFHLSFFLQASLLRLTAGSFFPLLFFQAGLFLPFLFPKLCDAGFRFAFVAVQFGCVKVGGVAVYAVALTRGFPEAAFLAECLFPLVGLVYGDTADGGQYGDDDDHDAHDPAD